MRAFVVLDDVDIRDYPEFVHRGIMLDTSRNFITVDVIKRLIRGMAHSKVRSVVVVTSTHVHTSSDN